MWTLDVITSLNKRIIKACRDLLDTNGNLIVKFVRREANMLAHNIIRFSKDYSIQYALDEPLVFVEDFFTIHAFFKLIKGVISPP